MFISVNPQIYKPNYSFKANIQKVNITRNKTEVPKESATINQLFTYTCNTISKAKSAKRDLETAEKNIERDILTTLKKAKLESYLESENAIDLFYDIQPRNISIMDFQHVEKYNLINKIKTKEGYAELYTKSQVNKDVDTEEFKLVEYRNSITGNQKKIITQISDHEVKSIKIFNSDYDDDFTYYAFNNGKLNKVKKHCKQFANKSENCALNIELNPKNENGLICLKNYVKDTYGNINANNYYEISENNDKTLFNNFTYNNETESSKADSMLHKTENNEVYVGKKINIVDDDIITIQEKYLYDQNGTANRVQNGVVQKNNEVLHFDENFSLVARKFETEA